MARGKSIRESWNMNHNRRERRVRGKVDVRSGSRMRLAKIGISPTQVFIHHCSPHRLQLDGISCAICKPPSRNTRQAGERNTRHRGGRNTGEEDFKI